MRAHGLCLLVSTLAVPLSAGAAELVGVLAVAPPPGPGPELSELSLQLRQAMSGRDPGVLEARQLRDRMAGQLPGASLEELDRAYEEARGAYASGDLEGSVRTLRAITEDLEKLPDGATRHAQWIRAMTRLAKAELDLGRDDSAQVDLERLVRAAPDVRVDPSLYPPKFARQVESARAQLNALPKGKLTVSSTDPGARVYVNGRDVGSAPASLTLPRGRYQVSGTLGSLRSPPVRADVGEVEEKALLDFTVTKALRPNQGPGLALPSDGDARIATAGGFLGLDSVVAVALAGTGASSQLIGSMYDVRRGTLTREGRVSANGQTASPEAVAALAEFLVTGQPVQGVEVREPPGAIAARRPDLKTPEPPARPIDLRTPEPPPPPAKKSTTLGWVAFATGVATVGFLGFGIAEGLSAKSSYDKATKLLVNGNVTNPADRVSYGQFVSDGNSARDKSTLGYAGAGVGLAVTGLLGYLSYKQTGEVGPFRF